eukprot:155980_1
MQTFKHWHSKHNWLWLKCDNHVNNYSSFQSILACLHPIIVLTATVIYVIFSTGLHEGDTQHFVTFKDAKPHWRVEPHYYNHMQTELNFTILNSQHIDPPFKLLQYYPTYKSDSRLMQCNTLIQNDHNLGAENVNKLIELAPDDSTQQLKANGILCYTERISYDYEHGLVLCNNYKYINDEYVTVVVETKEQRHLVKLDMKADTSYIVTLQLWINYKGNGKWEGNEVNVINIEEMKSKQFKIRTFNEDECESCYGLKVIQDRIVYEIEDGMNLKRFFINEFWFILVAYLISLIVLRGINWMFENKSSANNITKTCKAKETTDDGENDSTTE